MFERTTSAAWRIFGTSASRRPSYREQSSDAAVRPALAIRGSHVELNPIAMYTARWLDMGDLRGVRR